MAVDETHQERGEELIWEDCQIKQKDITLKQVHLKCINLLYTPKTSYVFWRLFVAIFSEMLYEGYVMKTSQPMCRYKILSFKCVV